MTRLLAPLRVRSTGEAARKVTWLELFFDLIFVAAVAQVAAPLRIDYTADGILRFATLFALIWWAWTGHAVFSTRFDSDDVVQRALTLVQVFTVAAMAANAKDALDSRSSAGFAAAYAVLRFVLVAQYIRASQLRDARPLTARYIAGHGGAAILWLLSAFVPAPGRFWIWAAAFAIDLGTPWVAVPHSIKVPPDAAHLPERFGLFTLILLGESVVAVMQGMESQEDWTPVAAASAFLGMGVAFLIWWWYFDRAAAASEQPVRSRRDAIRFHIWSYSHFPLYLGVVVTGVGMQRIVTAAARYPLPAADPFIILAAGCVVALSLSVIGATSAARRRAMHVAAAAIACIVFSAPAANAEPVKKIAVGVVVTSDSVSAASRTTVKATPFFRLRNTPGWHPAFGLNWVTSDLEMAMRGETGITGRLRIRPVMAGVSYTWVRRSVSISPRLIAGYAFNRLSDGGGASAENSLVAKGELQLWRDITPRVGIAGSIGYLAARPRVGGLTVRADAVRLQMGIAYAVF